MPTYFWPILVFVLVVLAMLAFRTYERARLRRRADRTDDPEEADRLRMNAKGLSADGSKLTGDGSGTGYGGV